MSAQTQFEGHRVLVTFTQHNDQSQVWSYEFNVAARECPRIEFGNEILEGGGFVFNAAAAYVSCCSRSPSLILLLDLAMTELPAATCSNCQLLKQTLLPCHSQQTMPSI
jgi:hypothetical protein